MKTKTQDVFSFTYFFSIIVLVLFSSFAAAFIEDLEIVDDSRKKIFIDNFGLDVQGQIKLSLKNFKLTSTAGEAVSNEPNVAFLIKKTETDSKRFLEEPDEAECSILRTDTKNAHILRITKPSEDFPPITIANGAEGFYNTYFVNCEEKTSATFHLQLSQYNKGQNYLSAGISPLPTVYGCLWIVYATALVSWIVVFMRGEGNKVYLIHYLMTLLVVLKTFSILFKAIEMHYLKINGHPGGWAVIYYIFAFLKGVMLFVVIALIGTGWTFVKPFLSDKDKKIFLIVIPLQILDNIAMVIIEETAPSSLGWFTWKDIFRLVDIICCGAILVPIIWSIKHLKEASQIDGKVQRNLTKLKLFRQFYLLVVSYIYFTRIIVYLLDATLPFRWVWLGDLFTELATFAFYCTTGYKFRPVPDNPYLSIEDDDLENKSTQR